MEWLGLEGSEVVSGRDEELWTVRCELDLSRRRKRTYTGTIQLIRREDIV